MTAFEPLPLDKKKKLRFLEIIQLDLEINAVLEAAKALDPQIEALYRMEVGVWEGFSLEEHIHAVLSQYKKYMWDNQALQDIDCHFFVIFLMFHDLGKPLAVLAGNKALQHQFTLPILKHLLTELGFLSEIPLAESLLVGDPIGGYIKGRYTLEDTILQISHAAEQAKLPIDRFYAVLKVYYLADASAYTKNAYPSYYPDNQAGLGWIFCFDNNKIEFRRQDMKQKIEILEEKISNFARQN